MNQFSRNLMLWAAIVLAMVMLFNMFQQPQSSAQKVSYTDFIGRVDGGQISSVEIQGNTLIGRGPDGASVQTYAPRDNELVSRLLDKKVEVKAQPPEEQPWYMTLLVSWFPMLLLIGVWIFFMRQMQGGGGKAMSFGRSRARLLNQDSARVTFEDVAGVDEAKDELSEVVEFLSNPKKFTRLGGRIPKGVLLVGPPGTGKTLLARAVAGEAGVPFFSISGSDFVEMFVGVGARNVCIFCVQGGNQTIHFLHGLVNGCPIGADENRLGVRIMLCLCQQVNRQKFRICGVISDNQYFARACQTVNADITQHLTLCLCDKLVARADNQIHLLDALCAVSKGCNCLRAAHAINFIRTGNIHRNQNSRMNRAITSVCRRASANLLHTGCLCSHNAHQRGARQRMTAGRYITAAAIYRNHAMTDFYALYAARNVQILQALTLLFCKEANLAPRGRSPPPRG